MLLVARLPVRPLTGTAAVLGELAARAGLEGNAVLAVLGEAVGALAGVGRGAVLLRGHERRCPSLAWETRSEEETDEAL